MLAHFNATLTGPHKIKRALHIIALTRTHRGEKLALPFELLEVQIPELWFGIKGVNVTGATSHVKKDTALGFCLGKMCHLCRQRPIGLP